MLALAHRPTVHLRPSSSCRRYNVVQAVSTVEIPSTNILDSCRPGSLLRAELENNRVLWLTVSKRKKDALEIHCDGEQLSVKPCSETNSQPPEFKHIGYWPLATEPWVKRIPGLAQALTTIRKQQKEEHTLPSTQLQNFALNSLELAGSLEELEQQASAHPEIWCDGAGPDDKPPTEQETALLTAGELLVFLLGYRGVCLLQLTVGWDKEQTSPLLRPFVLSILERVQQNKNIAAVESNAPQNLGTSIALHAKQQPFKAWGTYLAHQGVQAGIVADSAYYKLLIGLALGYKKDNIVHHIHSYGGSLTNEIVEGAQKELCELSSAPVVLPWTSSNGRKKNSR